MTFLGAGILAAVLIVAWTVWCLCVAAAEGDRMAERAFDEQEFDFELGLLLADGWDVPAERKRGGDW